MFIIGERINGMFANVKLAIREKNEQAIKDLARRQIDEGANILDVNVGPAVSDAEGAMLWLAETIRTVTDAPLAIDTARWEVLSAVVPRVQGPVILNSSKADPEILQRYLELAVRHDAGLIGLTIDADGVPGNIEKRVELGAGILAQAMESGLGQDKVFIDPIILPVNVAPQNAAHVLSAISQLRMFSDPPPHLIIGLSNVSQRCANRSLINRTFLAMCIAHGLDTAIVDPLDRELMDVVTTAELLMGRTIYCDSFLKRTVEVED